MKRIKQIGLSLSMLILTLFLIYWTSGFYFSPQACVEDSLRGLYFAPAEKILEICSGDRFYYLYANDHQYALHNVRKTAAFFYVTAGGSTHNDYPKSTEPFDLDFSADQANEVFLVHRNRPDIEKVEWELTEGSRKVLLDQWKDDFAMTVLPRSDADSVFWQGTVRAYDAQGKLVDERVFP